MLAESPEVIERQIADKRREMLTKVDDLTSRTSGTVRGAVNSLTDLTSSVSSTVGVVGDTLGHIGKMANPAAISELIRDTVGAVPVSFGAGPPAEVAACKASRTAAYLAAHLAAPKGK